MPNAKVLSEKQAIVEALVEKLQNSCAGVLVDYSGTTVETDTEMRRAMRLNDPHGPNLNEPGIIMV